MLSGQPHVFNSRNKFAKVRCLSARSLADFLHRDACRIGLRLAQSIHLIKSGQTCAKRSVLQPSAERCALTEVHIDEEGLHLSSVAILYLGTPLL